MQRLSRPRVLLVHLRLPESSLPPLQKNDMVIFAGVTRGHDAEGRTRSGRRLALTVRLRRWNLTPGVKSHKCCQNKSAQSGVVIYIKHTQVFRFGLNSAAAIVIGVVSQWRSPCKHCGLVCSRTAQFPFVLYLLHSDTPSPPAHRIHAKCPVPKCEGKNGRQMHGEC